MINPSIAADPAIPLITNPYTSTAPFPVVSVGAVPPGHFTVTLEPLLICTSLNPALALRTASPPPDAG